MEKFSYVDYSEFYRRNNSSQCLSIYTDKKSLLVYTGGIKVENEWLKKKEIQWSVIFTDKNTDRINLVIFIHEFINNI